MCVSSALVIAVFSSILNLLPWSAAWEAALSKYAIELL